MALVLGLRRGEGITNRWVVYQFSYAYSGSNTALPVFTYVGKYDWVLESSLDRLPSFGHDQSGYAVITVCNKNSEVRVFRVTANPALNVLDGFTVSSLPPLSEDFTSCGIVYSSDVAGWGSSGFKLWIQRPNKQILVLSSDGSTRHTSLEHPKAPTVGDYTAGVVHDNTRFWQLDVKKRTIGALSGGGNLNSEGTFSKHSINTGTAGVSTYSLYDADTAGAGVAETEASNASNFSVPKAAWLRLTTPPPDDDGSVDAPNTTRVYINNWLAETIMAPSGTSGWITGYIETLPTSGKQSETVNGFNGAGRAATAQGINQCSKSDTRGPIWKHSGTGAGRSAFLEWDSEGKAKGCFQRGKKTLTGIVQNTPKSENITFPSPFPAGVVPVVNVTAETSDPRVVLGSAASITNLGFILYGVRTNGTQNITLNWSADLPS